MFTPLPLPPVARAVLDEQMHPTHPARRNSSGNSVLPSRTFRYLQDQYNGENPNNMTMMTTTTTTTTVEETVNPSEGAGLRRGSNSHMPSRAFKYLQDQYDAQQGPVNRTQNVNNREDLAEIYNKRKTILNINVDHRFVFVLFQLHQVFENENRKLHVTQVQRFHHDHFVSYK